MFHVKCYISTVQVLHTFYEFFIYIYKLLFWVSYSASWILQLQLKDPILFTLTMLADNKVCPQPVNELEKSPS